jgi:ribosomal-protein-alanine N-acetyltransferase
MTKNGKKDANCGNFIISKIVKNDLPQIIEIENLCFPTPWKLSYFETELEYPHSTCLKISDGGRIIGYIILRNLVDEVHIMNIAVHPDLRKQGVATMLIEHVCNDVDVAKDRFMLLEVRRSNTAAQELYKKMGFINLYTRKSYYADGEDAIVMVKGYLEDRKD